MTSLIKQQKSDKYSLTSPLLPPPLCTSVPMYSISLLSQWVASSTSVSGQFLHCVLVSTSHQSCCSYGYSFSLLHHELALPDRMNNSSDGQSLDLFERVVQTLCFHLPNLYKTKIHLFMHKIKIHLSRSPMILSLSKLIVNY